MTKIACTQIEISPGHPDVNAEKILNFVDRAKNLNADLVIFPEMAVPGYLLGDTWEQNSFLRDCEFFGEKIISASQGITIIFGNVAVDWQKKNHDGRVRKYNALFAARDGKLIPPKNFPYPYVIKTLLPNYREFDDTRHFFGLQELSEELGLPVENLIRPLELDLGAKKYRVGCLLCEDGWSDNYNLSPIKLFGGELDFCINISSSPFTLGKSRARDRTFSAQAKSAGCPLIYVNSVGIQNNGKTIYTFDGSSTAYNSRGEVVGRIAPYSEELNLLELSEIEKLPAIKISPEPEVAEIYRALSYGVKKFLQQIHMERVVIGISGGIDSAVAAALYTKILGAENVLLVNMPSVFNSATTRGLSEQLARNLGCKYAVVQIQDSVDLTIRQLESTPINFLSDNSSEQIKISSFVRENIQARDRSARILAALAAAIGGGFTCNANKAETSVGYATLYGDEAGFLSALADLWKFQVYALAHYLNEKIYGREVVPQGIIDIVPSAELSDAQNVDEGKGDPLKYPYHDFLFRSFIERWNKATPEDILTWYAAGTLEQEIGCEEGLVKKFFPTAKDFIDDLERWWKLFTGIAVAKRIQSPPILAVSRRAYGFDHREAQNSPHFTQAYKNLKQKLLTE